MARAVAIGAVLACGATSPAAAYGPAEVAVGGDGTAHFGFLRSDGDNLLLQDRLAPAGGGLSDPEYVSPGGGQAALPAVAADASGDAIHVWVRETLDGRSIQTRRRGPDGSLSRVQTVSPAGGQPAVAVDAAGNAVFAWTREVGDAIVVQARRRTAAGLLSPVQSLTLSGRASNPRVAVDADGDAVISWLREGSAQPKAYVQARARAAGGALGPVQSLSSTTGTASSPSFAVAPDGRAAFAWVQTYASGTIVHARTRTADGTLSAVQNLTPVVQDATTTGTAIDGAGRSVFTWLHTTGSVPLARARTRAANGALSAIRTLSPATYEAAEPSVRMIADGRAVFAWRHYDTDNWVMQVQERAADGTYGPVRDLASIPAFGAAGPRLALAPDGTAWLSWWRLDDHDPYEHTAYLEARSCKPNGDLGPQLDLHRSFVEPR